jgi:MSHA biogenesis protein MshJ
MRIINFLKPWMARFDRMNLGQRAGLAAAAAAVLYFVLNVMLVGQGVARSKIHQQRIASQKTDLEAVRKEILILSGSLERDPNAQQQVQLDGMKRANAEAEALLAQFEGAAPAAGAILREVLAATPGIELLSLRTLPVTLAFQSKLAPVIPANPAAAPAKPVAAAATPAPGTKESAPMLEMAPGPPRSIYRHGIELKIQGNYLALLSYLEKLQQYPARLYWGDVSLDVRGYPLAELNLTVFTLAGQANPRLGSTLR